MDPIKLNADKRGERRYFPIVQSKSVLVDVFGLNCPVTSILTEATNVGSFWHTQVGWGSCPKSERFLRELYCNRIC